MADWLAEHTTVQDLIDYEVVHLFKDYIPAEVDPKDVLSNTEISISLGAFLAAMECAAGQHSPELDPLQQMGAKSGVRTIISFVFEHAIEEQNKQKENAQ